ncbi:transcription factor MYC2-like protein [Tanacetum coccineum]
MDDEFLILSPSSCSSIIPQNTQNSHHKLQFLLQTQPNDPWAFAIFWKTDHGRPWTLTWADGYFLQNPNKPAFMEIQTLVGPGSTDGAEWFYILSLARSFTVGDDSAPANSFASNSVIWLRGPHSLISFNCRRAKEAYIHGLETLVYIPTTTGVVEMGSYHVINHTESDLARRAKSLFSASSSSTSSFSSPSNNLVNQPNDSFISFGEIVSRLPQDEESKDIFDLGTTTLGRQSKKHGKVVRNTNNKGNKVSKTGSDHSDSDCHLDLKTRKKRSQKKKGHDLPINHVEAERQRRENLNQRFYALRSVVPYVSKMDKVSLLEDAVCYINGLKNKVEDLEAQLQAMNNQPKLKKIKVEAPDVTIVPNSQGANIYKNTRMNETLEVEVRMVDDNAMIRVQSGNGDWPSAKLMDALREMEAIVQHASMSCINDVMLQDVVARVTGVTADEVKYHLLARLNQ